MPNVIVIKRYQSEFPDPIRLAAGENVAVEVRPTPWAGWVWCTSSAGVAGWVPLEFIERIGDHGTMLRDYVATELTVAVGDRLEVVEEVSGWVWCRTVGGVLGWVPRENVELAQRES